MWCRLFLLNKYRPIDHLLYIRFISRFHFIMNSSLITFALVMNVYEWTSWNALKYVHVFLYLMLINNLQISPFAYCLLSWQRVFFYLFFFKWSIKARQGSLHPLCYPAISVYFLFVSVLWLFISVEVKSWRRKSWPGANISKLILPCHIYRTKHTNTTPPCVHKLFLSRSGSQMKFS